jgi:broad specificity phosphatase PhoE
VGPLSERAGVRVYVARHGETTWNLAGRYQGRRECELTALGTAQAAALAEAMRTAGVGRVLASPMLRTTATGALTADRLGLALETDERLIEIAHGSWEGRLRDEIAANDAVRYRAWRHDPAHVAFEGGETLAQVRERWRAFAASLASDLPALVVTHDAVARVALVEALGRELDAFWDVRVENGAYAVFDVGPTGWRLVEECVTDHLGELRAATGSQAL